MPKALHHSGFICFTDLFFAKQQIEGSDIHSTKTGPNGKKYA